MFGCTNSQLADDNDSRAERQIMPVGLFIRGLPDQHQPFETCARHRAKGAITLI